MCLNVSVYKIIHLHLDKIIHLHLDILYKSVKESTYKTNKDTTVLKFSVTLFDPGKLRKERENEVHHLIYTDDSNKEGDTEGRLRSKLS